MLKHPNQALCKLISITFFLFLIGLLPWVDNYAHLFGFVFGFLLSYALLPFISFGTYDRHKKIFLIWVCLAATWILFICLVLLFYIIPVYDCKVCSYFNCLPITRDFCASQNINFKREEPAVWHIILRLWPYVLFQYFCCPNKLHLNSQCSVLHNYSYKKNKEPRILSLPFLWLLPHTNDTKIFVILLYFRTFKTWIRCCKNIEKSMLTCFKSAIMVWSHRKNN